MASPQNDPDFSLAFSLLSAWSVADAELQPKIEALIAEYVERKPEFLDALKRVTNVSEQLGVVLSAVRSSRATPQSIEQLMLQHMTRKEGGTPSA